MDVLKLNKDEYFNRNMLNPCAVVYLNVTKEQKDRVEKARNETECIAIDFQAINLEPIECLNVIKNFCLGHSSAIEMYNQLNKKAMLIAQNPQFSKTSGLPKSLLVLIPKEKHLNSYNYPHIKSQW